MKTAVLTAIVMTAGILYAEIGDTELQAKERYGMPIGSSRQEAQTIHVYDTTDGRITEVYNDQGLCIESDAPRSSLPQILEIPVERSVETAVVAEQEPGGFQRIAFYSIIVLFTVSLISVILGLVVRVEQTEKKDKDSLKKLRSDAHDTDSEHFQDGKMIRFEASRQTGEHGTGNHEDRHVA